MAHHLLSPLSHALLFFLFGVLLIKLLRKFMWFEFFLIDGSMPEIFV